jgi:hypothetical protein
LFYEERIRSLPALRRCLRTIDQDAGLRLLGRTEAGRVLVFVTRFGRTYTMMSYSVTKGGAPAKRLETAEFQSPGEVERALKKVVKGRVRAWVY